MNVPKLRFKEFNDEWQKVKISSCVDESKRKTGDTKKYPLWSLTIENGVTPKTDRYERSFLVKKEDNYKIVYPNYYVYNPMNAHLGAIARNKSDKSISVSGYYDIFSINNDYYGFYDNYFISPVMFKKYKLISSGSLLEKQRVHYSQFKELKIYLPSDKEQKKIADMLELLDKKIELQTKKIEALKLFKLCILKHIFSSATVKTKLKNVSNITKGEQINSEELSKSGSYYMLNGGTEPSGYLEKYNTLENTITISEGGNSCGYVKYNKYKFWCGGHCYSIKNKLIDNHYLYQLLKFNEKKIMRLRIGSGLPNIQKKDLENFELFIHEKNNQYKIANLLMKYDTKIELEKNKLDKFTSLKTGLLQNMFI